MHSYCATAQSIAEENVSVNGEFLARATYLLHDRRRIGLTISVAERTILFVVQATVAKSKSSYACERRRMRRPVLVKEISNGKANYRDGWFL